MKKRGKRSTVKIMEYYSLLRPVYLTLLFLLPFSRSYSQYSPFTCKWSLIVEKSDFGGVNKAVAAPLEISAVVVKDSIFVLRIFEGNISFKERLKIAGAPVETFPDGNTRKLTSVKFSKAKDSIIFESHYEMDGKEWEWHRIEKWHLSNDGKVLTIYRVATLPNKVDKVKAVYDKSLQ